MKIRKSSRQMVLAIAWLAHVGLVNRLPAQQTPATKPLTVERIAEERERSETRPRNMSWSPDGKSLSFIRTAPKAPRTAHPSANAIGPASEVWSIDAVDGKEKLLVSSSQVRTALGSEPLHFAPEEDEAGVKRRRLAACLWAPGGHALLLTAPVSLAWFDLDAHTSQPLVDNGKPVSYPQISPDGRFVSFIQDHTLWLADVATGAVHAWTSKRTNDLLEGEPDWSYLHELGMHEAYWWSPNSSSIAWLETDDHAVDKYPLRTDDGEEQSIAYPKPGGAIPKVRLLVRAVSGGKAIPINLGSDANVYIPRVRWLPDGKHLAIERLSRSQKILELLLADPATGKAQSILTEKDDYWINLSDDLHFLKDSRRFLWSSERSGDRHLYLYDISGRQITQLTNGHWEVTALVGVDEKTSTVYFTATEATPLERPLYRVNLDGSGFARVTQNKGTHDLVMSVQENAFLDIWSDRASPPRASLLRLDGGKIGTISDKVADSTTPDKTTPAEFLTIKTHQGMDLNAWIMKPSDFDPARRYPAILYVAGGPGEQIVRDVWGGDISLWFSMMTQKGYVVFALDNRGTGGRGHLFEEPVHLRFSATEIADIRDGVLYLHLQPWIDKARIGICGWGYGGFLALHGMLDRPLMYKAGFAGSPIADWHLYDAVFTERYLEDPVRNQDGWLASSPVENAKYLNAPLLLAQAALDERVHLENSLSLLDELLDERKYADILLFPDRKDVFEDYGSRLVLFGHLTDFFVKNL